MCKHNWVESNFAKRYRKPNEYMYTCTRCLEGRFVQLTEKEKAPVL